MTQYIEFTIRNRFFEFSEVMPIYDYETLDEPTIANIIFDHYSTVIYDEARNYEPKRDWLLTKEQYEDQLVDFDNDFYGNLSITWKPCDEDTNDWLIAYDF